MRRNPLLDKVLAPPEGIPVIHQLTAEGINGNFALRFGPRGYRAGTNAYNTWPIDTLILPADNEHLEQSSDQNGSEADQILKDFPNSGIDQDASTAPLQDEKEAKFSEAFERLMAALHEEWAATFTELH